MSLWYDTVEKINNRGIDYLQWKTTPGFGDVMYGLNVAHFRAFVSQKPCTINFHWYHAEDFLYHYEDPETIIQRLDYIHSFYKWKDMINIEHTFNSTDTYVYKHRYIGYDKGPWCTRQWVFDDIIDSTPTYGKIVIWRPTFNADPPRFFKQPLNSCEWEYIIQSLRNLDYQVVEIDYRTPIREVLFHIRTCELVFSYEGMWHYISKNLFKPHIVLSKEWITTYHTPAAIRLNVHEEDIQKAQKKTRRYKNEFHKLING
jgi:hypothetical protein